MLFRDLFFRCLCGVTDTLIPEVSVQTILNAILHSAANINSGIEFSPPLASWLFIIALLNFAFPCAVTMLISGAQEYAGILLRFILTAVVFRIIWVAFTHLLAIVMIEYLNLSRTAWQWVSLLLLIASIASLVASLHTTGMICCPPGCMSIKMPTAKCNSTTQRSRAKAPCIRRSIYDQSSDELSPTRSCEKLCKKRNGTGKVFRYGGLRCSPSDSWESSDSSTDELSYVRSKCVTKEYAQPSNSRSRCPTRKQCDANMQRNTSPQNNDSRRTPCVRINPIAETKYSILKNVCRRDASCENLSRTLCPSPKKNCNMTRDCRQITMQTNHDYFPRDRCKIQKQQGRCNTSLY